jgi:hypothetical protein
LPENSQRRAPRVKRTLLPEGHHLFREGTNGFRLGQGGLDALVLD